MALIVVDVMPKPEILDPQGQAVVRALPTLGIEGVSEVRQGKHFELEVDGDEATALARAGELAERAAGQSGDRGLHRSACRVHLA